MVLNSENLNTSIGNIISRTMRNHLSETLMLNDIQITSDYMSRWIVLKRRVGAVTSQRILNGPKFREPQHINWKHNFKIIMDAVEDYARRWKKREVDQDPGFESLSDWVRKDS
jgi:hypothetical protein